MTLIKFYKWIEAGCPRSQIDKTLFVLIIIVLTVPALATEVNILVDFDRDNDLWTIYPYSDDNHGTFSIILEVVEGSVQAGAGVMLFVEYDMFTSYYGDHYDCIAIPCGFDIEWGNPEVLINSHMGDCPNCCVGGREIYGEIIEGIVLESGERYLLGSITGHLNSGDCDKYVDVEGYDGFLEGVTGNRVWFGLNPSPTKDETWGSVKSLYRENSPQQ